MNEIKIYSYLTNIIYDLINLKFIYLIDTILKLKIFSFIFDLQKYN